MGAAPWSTDVLETASYELRDGNQVRLQYKKNAGLGFVPWPATFALASYLDEQADQLALREKSALELGSGVCTVAGIVAGYLCREVMLTDRKEVVLDLEARRQAAGSLRNVSVKVLNWSDLEFTYSFLRRGQFDIIFMSDVVYFDVLYQPLLHTLLALCDESTLVLWANSDRFPHFTPKLGDFMSLVGDYFRIEEVFDQPQEATGTTNFVEGGRVVVRSMRLICEIQALDKIDEVMTKGCARRCFA